jgi:hypothetical protein
MSDITSTTKRMSVGMKSVIAIFIAILVAGVATGGWWFGYEKPKRDKTKATEGETAETVAETKATEGETAETGAETKATEGETAVKNYTLDDYSSIDHSESPRQSPEFPIKYVEVDSVEKCAELGHKDFIYINWKPDKKCGYSFDGSKPKWVSTDYGNYKLYTRDDAY